MNTYVAHRSPEADGFQDDRTSRLLLVVGFDGTASSERALRSAIRLLSDRSGLLEVVYVASSPAAVAFSAEAVAEVQADFDKQQRVLAERSESIIASHGVAWHFQRRDGDVAHELIAVAKQLAESGGSAARVGLVVGGSEHWIHRHLNAVPRRLIRSDRFSVLVVP